jgi:hypothetical protein
MKYAMGLWPPKGPPFSLNLAVDRLLKDEFDQCRSTGRAHSWLAGLRPIARPFAHQELDVWRDSKRGLSRTCEESGVTLYGAIDDVWMGDGGVLHVVDYKATASASAVRMDQPWHDSYRRQVEVYQWLLRGQGRAVSDVAYFLFCVVDESRGFAGSLSFTSHIVGYEGSDAWISSRLVALRSTLAMDRMPPPAPDCQDCGYRRRVRDALQERGWLR